MTKVTRSVITSNTQKVVPSAAAFGLIVAALLAWQQGSERLAIATLIGGLAGFSLYHAKFGFTAAWHRFVVERRGAGLRAQLLLIIVTSAITFPLFYYGKDFGLSANGFVFPFGVAAAIGAFLFGIGMQLGGSCASGTLFTVGGGSTRMMVTLIFFILGSVIATAHLPEWNQLPRLPALSLVRSFGAFGALAATAALLGAIALISVHLERKHHGDIVQSAPTVSVLKGPWSYLLGAMMLVVVSVGTVLVLGRPWGITSGFALWGAKWFHAVGIPIETWPYWANSMGRVERSVMTDSTSVMNFGIILGAMLAAGMAGRFAPVLNISVRGLLTAIVGGLLMGYGARLAYGCNIGAYLGGLISGSLHGWGWLV
ncbi:MAG: YeeE/YedE family protein, partial [Stappiaceae bacterium]